MSIKVHFAGSDNSQGRIVSLKTAGVNYRLFTCYPFIASKKPGSDMRVRGFFEAQIPLFEHTIMDSGLFTLMFGAKSGSGQSERMIREWQGKIIAFVKANGIKASIVECDCQKVVSPECAWDLRRELAEALPDHEIVNVFHLEDGRDGFERLCEFSSYIALSVPELRIAQPKGYRNTVCALARQARRINPDVKIHLLGCTELRLLKRNSFCTSADSSSWLSPMRYGFLGNHHIDSIRPGLVEQRAGKCSAVAASLGINLSENALIDSAKTSLCASYSLEQYAAAAGGQD